MEKLKSQKQLIIEHLDLKKMAYSAQEFSVQSKIMNVCAVNTNE